MNFCGENGLCTISVLATGCCDGSDDSEANLHLRLYHTNYADVKGLSTQIPHL